MTNKNDTQESILVGELLSLIAIGVTSTLGVFSGWLLGGFGAALALIVSNIETVEKFIKVGDIKTGVILYLLALATGVIQRWLAAAVMGGAEVSKEAKKLGANASDEINFENVLTELERATLYPQKWIVRYQFTKLRQGDFTVTGRMYAFLAQIQGFSVLIQGALVISSISVLISGINA